MTDTAFSTPLLALDAVVIDTETTGLDATTARVVQIAVVGITRGAIEADVRLSALIDPEVSIPPATSRVHGLTDRDVAGQPTFGAIASRLDAAVGGRVVIGHTIGYDISVLSKAYAAAGLHRPQWRTLDVRDLARVVAPGLADHSLDRLCEWLGITVVGRHTATGDARATAALFLALLPKLRAKNIRTLADAEAATQRLQRDPSAPFRAPTGPERQAAEAPFVRLDAFAYRTRVASVMSSPAVVVRPETSAGDVLRQLMRDKASSVFTTRPDGSRGIVTERDLLRAIDVGGPAALSASVDTLASGPLQCVAVDDFVYRAIGRMTRLKVRHLGVTDSGGALIGAVTTRDLLRHRSTTTLVLGDAIDEADDTAALGLAFAQLPVVARGLLADSTPARDVTTVISTEVCAMTERAAELAVATMARDGQGPPPQPFAVLVLGSAGRGESQLAADQDNAIVYAEGAEGSAADRWFAAMARHMTTTLDAAGVPFCKGGVMATSRAWRKSLPDWIATIDGWVRRSRPQDLLAVDIFFDAVAVYGERDFVTHLWTHAYERAHRARDFQNMLIESARQPASAFTLFGGFRVDTSGRMDLKKLGLLPMFTAARVLSIRHDVRARSSKERILGLADRGIATPDTRAAIVDAQELLLGAVLAQQLTDLEIGKPATTWVTPQRLSKTGQENLRAALKTVATAVDLASDGRV